MDYELSDEELRAKESELANGPTFEDLAIDDTLSDLQRVTKYVCSNIALQRVIHVKMLHETARSVGYEATVNQLLPLLEPLVCDVEYVVRQHVALQFPLLCDFLVKTEPLLGYRVLLEKLIPLVTKLVSDEQHEVRSAASESLVDMAALVRPEDQGQHVLTIVLPLAHDDDNEQFRISAVTLYNGLAEHFGPELCQQFCVPELISLSEDPVFRVRKSTALCFSNVCKTAGMELSRERLIPAFQRLAKDDIWGVRKACAECLVSVALALTPADRGPILIPMFENFIIDSSRWVRMAAYQSLGPFLVALKRNQVSDDLVGHFVSMATTAASQLGGSGEADIKYHCAYNFPAVVSILGVAEWPKVSSAFELLHNDTYWKIRRSFAYSLHELARILGQGITETQLVTAFDSYLHDVQDVRLGVMLHFADFLENVSPSFRESYLPVLAKFDSFDNTTKWRFREVLSGQLTQLCRIFTSEATFSVIHPLVFKLVTDPVAVVREQSYHACPLLVARLNSNAEWLTAVVDKFVTLAHSSHYQDRQCFVKICASFLLAKYDNGNAQEDIALAGAARDFFSLKLAVVFFMLAVDPVSNVRVVFAETTVKHQELCREHPECPNTLRDILTATTFSSVDALAAVLSGQVKEQVKLEVEEDAESRNKDLVENEGISRDAEKETTDTCEAVAEPLMTASPELKLTTPDLVDEANEKETKLMVAEENKVTLEAVTDIISEGETIEISACVPTSSQAAPLAKADNAIDPLKTVAGELEAPSLRSTEEPSDSVSTSKESSGPSSAIATEESSSKTYGDLTSATHSDPDVAT